MNPLTPEPSYTQIRQVKLSLFLAWRLLPSPFKSTLFTCRNETLHAVFYDRMEAYGRRVGRPGQMKLVVFSIDSVHVAIQTPGNHDTLKRTYSSKIGHNAVVCTVIASADSLPCWMGCLSASVSPSNTDERLASLFLRLNGQGNIVGGLLDFLTGPVKDQGLDPGQVPFHDFYTVLLMDKGYKTYGRQAAGSKMMFFKRSSL